MLLCSLNITRRSEFPVGLKEPTSGGGVIWAVLSGSFIFWLLLCTVLVLAMQFIQSSIWDIDASSVLWVVTKFLRCWVIATPTGLWGFALFSSPKITSSSCPGPRARLILSPSTVSHLLSPPARMRRELWVDSWKFREWAGAHLSWLWALAAERKYSVEL